MLIGYNCILLMIIVVDFNDQLAVFRTSYLGSKNVSQEFISNQTKYIQTVE